MLIEIDLTKLERGLRREKVKVRRKTGTTYEYRRVGQKEIEKPFASWKPGDPYPEGLEVGATADMGKFGKYKIVEIVDGSVKCDNGRYYRISDLVEIIKKSKSAVEEKQKSELKPKVEEKRESLTQEDYEEDESSKYVDGYRTTVSGRKILKSVSDYSGFEYKHINSYLRNPRGEKEDPTIGDIREFIRAAPKCSSEVYRGMGFNGEEGYKEYKKILSQFKEGKNVKVKSFTSTSLSENVAKRFWEGREGYDYRIRFDIKSKNGAILDGAGIEEEMEVLFMDKTRFKITKVSIGIDGRNAVIEMEEI